MSTGGQGFPTTLGNAKKGKNLRWSHRQDAGRAGAQGFCRAMQRKLLQKTVEKEQDASVWMGIILPQPLWHN